MSEYARELRYLRRMGMLLTFLTILLLVVLAFYAWPLIRGRFFPAVEIAPVLQRREWRNFGRSLGQLSLRRVLVIIHRIARAMNDENALRAGGLQDFVHARRHFGDSAGRAFAPVLVPHVADDDGGFARVESHGVFHHFEFVGIRRSGLATACVNLNAGRIGGDSSPSGQ